MYGRYRTMHMTTAYHLDGRYSLKPLPGARPITICCAPGVTVRTSAAGDRLLYREGHVYGQTVAGALALRWCRLAKE